MWTETCPQYLLLTDTEMERLGPFAKIGPPLRPAGGPDRAALWAGLERGFISTLASDHSPRVPAAKEPGWKNIFVDPEGKPVPFGAPSLETLWRSSTARAWPSVISLTWMARVLSENPPAFGSPQGRDQIGADADLTIWDPRPSGRSRPKHLCRGLHAYEGWQVRPAE